MSTVHPIACHPWPLPDEQLEVLKQAKARMNVNFRIAPVEGGPGIDGRVLAFGELPPYLCKFAPVLPVNVLNVDSVEAALRFALGDVSDRYSHADWLESIFGEGVELLEKVAL